MYRQNRRHNRRKNVIRKFGSCKFRKPRWKNRRDKLNWNPTLRHLIESHCNLLNKIVLLVGVDQTKIHIEYSSFDIHRIVNPRVNSFWYQLGPQYQEKNVSVYVKKRDGYQCQLCKSRVISDLRVHHIIPRSRGGSDQPKNLVTVCVGCHTKIHAGKAVIKATNKIFRDTGVLNSCMKKIFESLDSVVVTQHTFGYITDVVRRYQNLEKTHAVDASIIALCDSLGFQEEFFSYEFEDLENEIMFIQKRRHVRNHTSRMEDRKYYDGKTLVAKNRRRREGQTEESLMEFRKNYQTKVIAKPGVKRSRITNTKVLFRPGDKILYKNQVYTCFGWASTQGKVGLLEIDSYVPKRSCKKIANNSGLVCVR